MRESYGIKAPAPGDEHDLATSAQAVDSEKYLVPRQIGTSTRDLFEVARACVKHDVDHLIFHGRMLCHAPPFEVQYELLRRRSCIVGAKGWYRRI
jgi:hypothetical protein